MDKLDLHRRAPGPDLPSELTCCTFTGTPRNLLSPRVPSQALGMLEDKWRALIEDLKSRTKQRASPVEFSDSRKKHPEISYKFVKHEVKVVKMVYEKLALSSTSSHNWNLLWCTGMPRKFIYHGLTENQRINHFPSANEITRKDKLCNSILYMQEQYGKTNFDIVPETFILPEEFEDFHTEFHSQKPSKWIIKPPASCQGRGIYIVDSLKKVPTEESCIISKYIENPLLINALKSDLRVYVLVTCYEPLRIYVYSEGLVRFASEPFTLDKNAKFAHLTNYSVNRKNGKFIHNKDYRADDVGHKWSLSALTRHLKAAGEDTELLWARIYDLITKTIISAEEPVIDSCRRLKLGPNNCFDLFGFDILLDSALKPWLLEVNLSPSLNTDASLDHHIKSNLMIDTYNLLGIRKATYIADGLNSRLQFKQTGTVSRVNPKINSVKFSPFKERLRDTLEEYERKGNYIRIFPAKGTSYYHKFLQSSAVINKKIYNALFPGLETSTTRSAESTKGKGISPPKGTPLPVSEKVVLTGDDILIEYTSRIWAILKTLQEEKLNYNWKRGIQKFVNHSIWYISHTRNNESPLLWRKLETRLFEMKERRMQILKNSNAREDHRRMILQKFSATKLENILKTSCRNTAADVVVNFFDSDGKGILSSMIDCLSALPGKDATMTPERMVQGTIPATHLLSTLNK